MKKEVGNAPKSERNYTIEFFRFMLAVNFVFLHIYTVIPMKLGGTILFNAQTDIILVFAAFAGYFLMQNFKRQQAESLAEGVSAGRQAWLYLKTRLISLWPMYAFTMTLGVIGTALMRRIPIVAWPMYFINSVGEFLGLQITGLGAGNSFIGMPSDIGVPLGVAVGPLWFLSGLFVCGYIIYFLLAKLDKTFTDFIAPVIILLYWGSQHLQGIIPSWYDIYTFGNFSLMAGLIHTFTMLCVGVIIWIPVDRLKDKELSKGMLTIISVFQLFMIALIFLKSWVSLDVPIAKFLQVGWSGTFIYCCFFVFLTILKKDAITKLPIWNNKIWKIPGKMALYIYMLHYPLITYVMIGMGINPGAGWDENIKRIPYLFIWTLVVTLILSVLMMHFNDKVLQPWLANKPWYSKKQKELEAKIEA